MSLASLVTSLLPFPHNYSLPSTHAPPFHPFAAPNPPSTLSHCFLSDTHGTTDGRVLLALVAAEAAVPTATATSAAPEYGHRLWDPTMVCLSLNKNPCEAKGFHH